MSVLWRAHILVCTRPVYILAVRCGTILVRVTPSIRYYTLQRLQEDEEDEMDDFLDDDSTGEESEPYYSDDSESEKKKK